METERYEAATDKEKLQWCAATFDRLTERLNDLRQNKAIGSRELSLAYTELQTARFWFDEAMAG